MSFTEVQFVSGARRTSALRRSALSASAFMLVSLAACDLGVTNNSETAETLLAEAVNTTPVGFSMTENSYAGAESDSWRPMRRRHGGRGGPFGSAFGATGFMGGGLNADFAHGQGFRAGVARGPFGGDFNADSCAFSAATGKISCGPTTDRRGLTSERWVIYTDINGAAQARPDSTTAKMQTHAEVSGTVTVRDSSTRTVRHVSDRTITGLQAGSTQRTINGSSNGTETVNGFNAEGAFTANRTVSDLTEGLVIPVRTDGRSYPTAGKVTRSMTVAVTVAGGETETATWKEVLTYDGTATASLVITRNGTTRTCAVPLPAGRPVCE